MAVRTTRESVQVSEIPTRKALVTRESVQVSEIPVANARVTRISIQLSLPYYTPPDNEAIVTRESAQVSMVPTRIARVSRESASVSMVPTRIARVTRVSAQLSRPWINRQAEPTYNYWPGSLPQLLDSGATEMPRNNALRSKVGQTGPIKGRFLSYTRVRSIRATMSPFTIDQKNALEVFYTTTLASGSLPFVAGLDNSGVNRIYKFTAAPTYAPMGEFYSATFELSILDSRLNGDE